MKTIKMLSLAAALLFSAGASWAENYAIDWYTIDGGGGTSTGGVFSVSGTIGQPDAGAMSGGAYTLQGGFWGIVSAIQTPGSPLLSIFHSTTNTVVISWPSPSSGFVLQQNQSLSTTNWVGTSQTPIDDGVTRSIVIKPPVGNWFFRLKQ